MSDPSVRDRVTAILTLAEAAYYEPWEADGAEIYHAVTRDWIAEALSMDQQAEGEANAAFIAASRSETPWLARRLLEALDTIDRLEAENERITAALRHWLHVSDEQREQLQALNGGNE